MECLSVRLKMPQFTCITLQPLFKACPGVEMIIANKAKHAIYHDFIELQNFLKIFEHHSLYRGVTITQEYFWYMEQSAGFLKAQITMTHNTMPRDKIIRLFDYGMMDWIIFNHPDEVLLFGEKMQMTIGAITQSESVQA